MSGSGAGDGGLREEEEEAKGVLVCPSTRGSSTGQSTGWKTLPGREDGGKLELRGQSQVAVRRRCFPRCFVPFGLL